VATAATRTLARGLYETFQRAEIDGWDRLVAPDVLFNSPAGYGVRGLETLRPFVRQFTDLACRIDHIDVHEALDAEGVPPELRP
jgi:hypothetical protein